MYSHGVSWVRTQVDALCALDIVLPIVWSRTSWVPAVLESRIRLVRRPSIRSYDSGPHVTVGEGISARQESNEGEIFNSTY